MRRREFLAALPAAGIAAHSPRTVLSSAVGDGPWIVPLSDYSKVAALIDVQVAEFCRVYPVGSTFRAKTKQLENV